MSRLIHSAKFWLLVLDTVVSLLTMILTLVLAPDQREFAFGIIATLQPLFIFVIKAICDEDIARAASGNMTLKP